MIALKIAICDDSVSDLTLLYDIVNKYFNGAVDITLFENSDKLNDVSDGDFDVIIMDIMLENGISGIDVIKNASFLQTAVIFISSNPEFFLDVYEAEHIYFITKPIEENRIFAALKKAERLRDNSYIDIGNHGHIKYVRCDSIVYFEAFRHHTNVYFDDGGRYEAPLTISNMLKKTDSAEFVRCHRGYAVNLNWVSEITSSKAILKTGLSLPLGRIYAETMKNKLLQFWGHKI